jgi:hypothetical protein
MFDISDDGESVASEAHDGPRALGRRALEVESNRVVVATIALIAVIGIAHPDFLASTRGVDVGAKAEMHALIRSTAEAGAPVLAGSAVRTHAVLEAINQGSNVSS